MPPKGASRGGRGSGRGRAKAGSKKFQTVQEVIPEEERPSAEALAAARQLVLGGNYSTARSKEGCYNSWCHKNGINPSADVQSRDSKLNEIIYYTAFMSQKKGVRKSTTTTHSTKNENITRRLTIPMASEEMDRKLGSEKSRLWREAKTESGEWAIKREPCPVTGSTADPLQIYQIPRRLLEEVDIGIHEKKEDLVMDQIDATDPQAGPAVHVKPKLQVELTLEQKQQAMIKTFLEGANVESVNQKLTHWKSEMLMMIPKLAENKFAKILQGEVEEYCNKIEKAQSSLGKVMKATEVQINKSAVIPLKLKIEHLEEEFVNYCNWGERFNVKTSKRARKQK